MTTSHFEFKTSYSFFVADLRARLMEAKEPRHFLNVAYFIQGGYAMISNETPVVLALSRACSEVIDKSSVWANDKEKKEKEVNELIAYLRA